MNELLKHPDRIEDLFRDQGLVRGDRDLAENLAASAEIEMHDRDWYLYFEGDECSEELYFILRGSVGLFLNGEHLNELTSGQAVGEFPFLDPAFTYTVSARARKDSVIAKIPRLEFEALAIKHPEMWKRMARMIATRLHVANSRLPKPNERPRLFIGSSVEGLDVAREIQNGLDHDEIDVCMWSDAFPAGETYIESIINQAERCDFGAFAVLPDDEVMTRGKAVKVPRDNVVFEIGLFMGRVGRDRTLIIKPRGKAIKIPTDLLGLTTLEYGTKEKSDPQGCMGSVVNSIRTRIYDVEPREKIQK